MVTFKLLLDGEEPAFVSALAYLYLIGGSVVEMLLFVCLPGLTFSCKGVSTSSNVTTRTTVNGFLMGTVTFLLPQ